MGMTYALAFSIYKQGIKDDDGMSKVAEVQLGLVDGPLAGLTIEGITIKGHKERGLKVVYPSNMTCFLKEGEDEMSRTLLHSFADAFTVLMEKGEKNRSTPCMDDFTGYPEPASKYIN